MEEFYNNLKDEYLRSRSTWKKEIRYIENSEKCHEYKLDHNTIIGAIYIPKDATRFIMSMCSKIEYTIIIWSTYDDKCLEEILAESREIPEISDFDSFKYGEYKHIDDYVRVVPDTTFICPVDSSCMLKYRPNNGDYYLEIYTCPIDLLDIMYPTKFNITPDMLSFKLLEIDVKCDKLLALNKFDLPEDKFDLPEDKLDHPK
jgi:hypothetical protein